MDVTKDKGLVASNMCTNIQNIQQSERKIELSPGIEGIRFLFSNYFEKGLEIDASKKCTTSNVWLYLLINQYLSELEY